MLAVHAPAARLGVQRAFCAATFRVILQQTQTQGFCRINLPQVTLDLRRIYPLFSPAPGIIWNGRPWKSSRSKPTRSQAFDAPVAASARLKMAEARENPIFSLPSAARGAGEASVPFSRAWDGTLTPRIRTQQFQAPRLLPLVLVVATIDSARFPSASGIQAMQGAEQMSSDMLGFSAGSRRSERQME
jgi:hypothetical protein